MSKKDFIQKSKEIHGNIYDYSLVEYINNKVKVKIICQKHGIFEQYPCNHTNKKSICPTCSYENRTITTEEFIKRSKEIHTNTYDYSESRYIHNKKKIKIICKKHGVFEQLPFHHLIGQGCLSCKLDSNRIKKEDFIIRSNIIHNFKYDYSLVDFFKNNTEKIKIICPQHGIFEQRVGSHLEGCGCKKCSFENENLSEFLRYQKQIRNLTKKYKKSLFDNWNGLDYYDNEYIKENLNLSYTDKNYPTIDHKISIFYGFKNNIPPDDIGSIDNLCITKRCINSSKGIKTSK